MNERGCGGGKPKTRKGGYIGNVYEKEMNMDWLNLDTLMNLAGLLTGGGFGVFFTWRYMRRKARAEAEQAEAEAKQKEAEAKSAEVDMAQKVQDTYQEMLEYKQKEVDDNHRLISELREDRDHYKQGYVEFRDKLEKLDEEFRDFRKETEEERTRMKRDIEKNSRQLEGLKPFLCGREGCAIRVPVIMGANGMIDKGGCCNTAACGTKDSGNARKGGKKTVKTTEIEPIDGKDI